MAADYLRAVEETPRKPIAAIAEQYGVSVATAGRWIRRAKEMGLIA